MEVALSIKNLNKTYASGTVALKDVSLEVPAGDFYALLGPNGAGKTTLIGSITGLVTKTSGSISVFGTDLDSEPEKLKAYIGVVPQEINFNFFEKVIDIVVTQGGYYGIPRSIAVPRAEEILKGLNLYEKRFDQAMALSGGMKRRVMIARALIHEPQFLILDEPTAGVDVELRRGMWDFLKSLTKKGVTILLTTHYLEEAEQLCKHVAIINKGNIIAQGTMSEILGKLQKEIVILDLLKPTNEEVLEILKEYNPKVISSNSLEIEIENGKGVTPAILTLHSQGIEVEMVRGKSGRLEEVFVNLTKE